jgi:hypothetical protein
MSRDKTDNPVVITSKAVSMLSIFVTEKDKHWVDEEGRTYWKAPNYVYLIDSMYELQEVEMSDKGAFWHYHQVKGVKFSPV